MKSITPGLYIRLPWYKFYDSPHPGSRDFGPDEKYIPRDEIEKQLRARLIEKTSSRSGSILVTGYRGVGKTSLVRKVLWELDKAGKMRLRDGLLKKVIFELGGPGELKIHPLEINLAEDEINERAILRLLAVKLLEVMRRIRVRPWDYMSLLLRLLPFLCAAMTFWLFSPLFPPHFLAWCFGQEPCEGAYDGVLMLAVRHMHHADEGFAWVRAVDALLIPALLALWAYSMANHVIRRTFSVRAEFSISKLKKRLEGLITRMSAEMVTESVRGLQTAPFNPFQFGRRKSMSYQVAKTKEIELELIDILAVFGHMDNKRYRLLPQWLLRPLCRIANVEFDLSKEPLGKHRIVFLIDELDKLIPQVNRGIAEKDSENPMDDLRSNGDARSTTLAADQYRKRQESIARLFANLKHFLNVAQAKFVFVGGREMFDAVLADTSNRDSFFSSVFNHVIYVPSFLKENQQTKNGARHGITTTVERFVYEALVPEERVKAGRIGKDPVVSIEQFRECQMPWLEMQAQRKEAEYDLAYVSNALQNYCIYLTFRSNGIPKKLVTLFERSVITLEKEELEALRLRGDTIVLDLADDRPGLFLRLDAVEQQAHTVLSYFCRPITSLHSNYYRSLNDKQLVSLTYLLDHLFKFHPNAFSFAHLELAPESIAVNKVPEVRKYISDILLRLSTQHLRAVDNGLYGYVFYSKTYQEIAYLSKVSEVDSAAMNFTLDESLPVKQLLHKRLEHLKKSEGSNEHWKRTTGTNPIADLHNQLGDLYFFDAQHEEAIEHYKSAALYYEHGSRTETLRRTMRKAEEEEARLAKVSAAATQTPAAADPAKGASSHVDVGTHFSLSLVEEPSFSYEHLNQYIKLTLKVVHCLERTKAMDDAFVQVSALSNRILDNLELDMERIWRGEIDLRTVSLAISYSAALNQKAYAANPMEVHVNVIGDLMRRAILSNRTPQNHAGAMRLFSMANTQIGSILFYANREVGTLVGRGKSRFKSEIAYARSINFMLRGIHSDDTEFVRVRLLREDLRLLRYPDMPNREEGQSPSAKHLPPVMWFLLVANALSKHSDALIAKRTAGPADLQDCVFFGLNLERLMRDERFGEISARVLITAEAYAEAQQSYQAVFQVKKLIYLLHTASAEHDQKLTVDQLGELESLADWAKTTVHAYNGHIDELQLRKQREKRGGRSSSNGPTKFHDGISYFSELLEVDILRFQVLLSHSTSVNLNDVLVRVRSFLEHCRKQSCTQFAKALLYELILQYNWERIGKSFTRQFQKSPGATVDFALLEATDVPIRSDDPSLETLASLAQDSIHTAFQLLGVLNLSGISWVSNHTRLGYARLRLADWCRILEELHEVPTYLPERAPAKQAAEEIESNARDAMEVNVSYRLGSLMNYTLAKDELLKAIASHSGGKDHRRLMGDMFFLEDDYADNLYHFSCALERRAVEDTEHGIQPRIASINVVISALEKLVPTMP